MCLIPLSSLGVLFLPSFLLLQALHDSHNRVSKDRVSVKAKMNNGTSVVLKHDKSYYLPGHLPAGLYNPPANLTRCDSTSADFMGIRTWNEGTTQWKQLCLDDILSEIDFPAILGFLLRVCGKDDAKRGVISFPIGFSDGRNCRREMEELVNHYGCAMNGLTHKEATEIFKFAFIIMSKLGQRLGVEHLQENGSHPTCDVSVERTALYSARIIARYPGKPSQLVESISLNAQHLFPAPPKTTIGHVKLHMDKMNCEQLPDTISAAATVFWNQPDNFGVYRVNCLAYWRKACQESIPRRLACKELAEHCLEYVRKIDPALTPLLDHTPYYRLVGSEGIAIAMYLPKEDDDKISIVGACLLTPPSLQKSRTFISPISDALRRIYLAHPGVTVVDLVAMALPVCHVPGIFSLVCSLNFIADSPVFRPKGDLGYLETLTELIASQNGGYTNGRFPRSTVSWTKKTMDKKRVRMDIEYIADLLFNKLANTKDPGDCNYQKYCRDKLYSLADEIIRHVYGAGDFSAGHFIMVLAHLMLLPTHFGGVLNAARFALSTSKLVRSEVGPNTPNPRTIEYLNSGRTRGLSGRRDKARILMESVQPHLVYGKSGLHYFTDECLEQANCECHRTKAVVDMQFGGQSSFCLSCANPDSRTILRVHPTFERGSGFKTQLTALENLPTKPHTSKFFGPDAPEILVKDLELGKKNGEPGSVLQVRIPGKFLLAFPSLLEDIRVAMFASHGSTWLEFDHAKSLRDLEDIPLLVTMALFFARNKNNVDGYSPDMFKEEDPDGFDWNPNQPPFRTSEQKICRPKRPKYRSYSIEGAVVRNNACHEEKEVKWGNYSQEYITDLKKIFAPPSEYLTLLDCPSSIVADDIVEDKKFEDNADWVLKSSDGKVDKAGDLQPIINSCSIPLMMTLVFPSKDYCTGVLVSSLSSTKTLSSLKLIQSNTSDELRIGSLHSEVMEAILPKNMVATNVLSKHTLRGGVLPDECLAKPSQFRSHGKFQAYWEGVKGLDFFVMGKCYLVDQIAKSLGGISCSTKTGSLLPHWIFNEFEKAERHFMFCLLLTSGREYFWKRLIGRILKVYRKSNPRSGLPPVHCSAVVIQSSAGVNIQLFHVIITTLTSKQQELRVCLPCSNTECTKKSHDENCCVFFQPTYSCLVGDDSESVVVRPCRTERHRLKRKRQREKKQKVNDIVKAQIVDGAPVFQPIFVEPLLVEGVGSQDNHCCLSSKVSDPCLFGII